jgi:hypothetical protein
MNLARQSILKKSGIILPCQIELPENLSLQIRVLSETVFNNLRVFIQNDVLKFVECDSKFKSMVSV